MAGCENTPDDAPGTGDVIDHTDPKAPKDIKSGELVSLKMGFFRYETDPAEGGFLYTFSLQADGEMAKLSEEERYKISCEVERDVLDQAGSIIEQFELSKWNGQDRCTSGLPEEYSPCYLSAEYASGEKLYFRKDGDPEADWSGAFLKYFREILAEHGYAQALPPEASYVIDRFDFAYNEGEVFYRYGNLLMPGKDTDYITCLHKNVWSLDGSVEEEKIIRIPDGFFAKVKDLAEECNLYELANWSIRPPAFKSGEDDYYEFTLETTDGRQFNGWYQGEEIPEEMAAIKEKVVAFYEQALAQGEAYSATH